MKNPEELQRAIHLLSLVLTGQVTLPRPMSPDAILNTQGLVRALQWTLGQPHMEALDQFLKTIEEITEGPSFNPHTVVNE